MIKIMNNEENEPGLNIYLHSHIDISQVPEVILTSLLTEVEKDIAKYYDQKEKRKRRRQKNKESSIKEQSEKKIDIVRKNS